MKKKVLLLLSSALAAAVCSCGRDDGPQRPVRSEYITVYETSPEKTVDDIQIPFEGVQDGQIHVLTNVPVQWKYFVDQTQTGTDWFKVKSVEEIESGHIVVTYDAESILSLNSLDRRSGRLSFLNLCATVSGETLSSPAWKRQPCGELSAAVFSGSPSNESYRYSHLSGASLSSAASTTDVSPA